MPAKTKTPSPLEARFARLWDAAGGPELVREYRFDKTRKWRADFALEAARMLVEIEGGVWTRGRHLSPRGFIKDAEKYLSATLQGWAVLRLTEPQLNADTIRQILDYARCRQRLLGEPVA
ncbi:MAG: hypothetical protein Q4F30_06235 [Akkermansia sp.]|nr:hypothetical protein [Akkermansia sp.]